MTSEPYLRTPARLRLSKFGNARGPHARVAFLLCAALAASSGCEAGSGQKETDTQASLTPETIKLALQNGCAPAPLAGRITRSGADQLDLLIVVDRSSSMEGKLQSLSVELGTLIQALTSGDVDGDGTSDILPVESLRVALTTSDLGTAQSVTPECVLPRDGANLLPTPSGARYFEFTGSSTPAELSVFSPFFASISAQGCGYEQPFEAALSALTGDAPYADVGGSWPAPVAHDFLREDSVLAVLMVTDEDDCSVLATPEQSFFALSHPDYPEGGNIRCALHADDPGLMRSTDDFVARLRELRDNVQTRFILAALAGVPAGVEKTAAEWLSDPALELMPLGPIEEPQTTLKPSCEAADIHAQPPLRIARAVAELGSQGVLQSICDPNFGAPLAATLRALRPSFEAMPTCED